VNSLLLEIVIQKVGSLPGMQANTHGVKVFLVLQVCAKLEARWYSTKLAQNSVEQVQNL